jgi:hypothetical protein
MARRTHKLAAGNREIDSTDHWQRTLIGWKAFAYALENDLSGHSATGATSVLPDDASRHRASSPVMPMITIPATTRS